MKKDCPPTQPKAGQEKKGKKNKHPIFSILYY